MNSHVSYVCLNLFIPKTDLKKRNLLVILLQKNKSKFNLPRNREKIFIIYSFIYVDTFSGNTLLIKINSKLQKFHNFVNSKKI